jgi:glutamine amidotransferase/cyclase
MPMLKVLEMASERVFVPLTVGGGIRDYTDINSVKHSALNVAARYFRAGADKISLGSDAVYAAEAYIKSGVKSGTSSIEQISSVYGRQAVVISVDPRRVYVDSPDDPQAAGHTCLHLPNAPGPNGEQYAWYQCTVKGGREGKDMDAVQLVKACEALGAGEILLNCIDTDGQKAGFDLELVK